MYVNRIKYWGTKYYFANLRGFYPFGNDFVNAPLAFSQFITISLHTSILKYSLLRIQTMIFASDI
jgi:hypothetical protein